MLTEVQCFADKNYSMSKSAVTKPKKISLNHRRGHNQINRDKILIMKG